MKHQSTSRRKSAFTARREVRAECVIALLFEGIKKAKQKLPCDSGGDNGLLGHNSKESKGKSHKRPKKTAKKSNKKEAFCFPKKPLRH